MIRRETDEPTTPVAPPKYDRRSRASTNGHHPVLREIELDLGRGRRWAMRIGWMLLFALVGSVLVYLFARLTNSLRLAMAVVIFMAAYMVLMGWMASGKLDRRRDPFAGDDDVSS
jgi:hypothetical protein